MNTPSILAILGNLGPWEIVMIMIVVLLLFGGKKIPELSRGVARGLKVFKEVVTNLTSGSDGAPALDEKRVRALEASWHAHLMIRLGLEPKKDTK